MNIVTSAGAIALSMLMGAAVTDNAGRKNVLGEPLAKCCDNPKTGYFRDGMCRTDDSDHGTHTVCAKVTQAFLEFTKQRGNDLITPRPESRFAGLEPGDRWCLCALRWKEAFEAGVAPPVDLAATDMHTLKLVPLEALKKHAAQAPHDG